METKYVALADLADHAKKLHSPVNLRTYVLAIPGRESDEGFLFRAVVELDELAHKEDYFDGSNDTYEELELIAAGAGLRNAMDIITGLNGKSAQVNGMNLEQARVQYAYYARSELANIFKGPVVVLAIHRHTNL